MNKLTQSELKIELKRLSRWSILNDNLFISYKLDSFMQVMSFANLVSDKSEQMNHHPKFVIEYNNISFELFTHDISGISSLDIELANFIDETYNELFST